MSLLDNKNDEEAVQPPVKRGPPPGVPRRGSRDAARRLAQLNFDPIQEAVKLFDKISNEIEKMEMIRDGKVEGIMMEDGKMRMRFSSMAYANLLILQQKTINDLIRYGYARVSETQILQQNTATPLLITMTKKGEVYNDLVDAQIQQETQVTYNEDDEDET